MATRAQRIHRLIEKSAADRRTGEVLWRPDEPTTLERALQNDFSWTVHDVVGWTRAMPPARRGRSLHSDTGFPLLGAVVERFDGVTVVQAFFDGRLFDAALTGFRAFSFKGHPGASGVVWYRDARSGVIVVGTVNQLAQRRLPYQLMIRTAAAAASEGGTRDDRGRAIVRRAPAGTRS